MIPTYEMLFMDTTLLQMHHHIHVLLFLFADFPCSPISYGPMNYAQTIFFHPFACAVWTKFDGLSVIFSGVGIRNRNDLH